MSFNHSPGGRLCLSLALSLSVSLSISTTLYFLLLSLFFFLHLCLHCVESRSLISRAIRSVYVLSNEGRVRPTATSLPPSLPPLLLRVLNFTLTTSTFYSSRSPIRIPTLLYYLFYFYSRRVCKPSSVLSVLVFPRHEGVEGGGEGVEIGRQPSPRPRTLHSFGRDIFEGDLPARPPTESNP